MIAGAGVKRRHSMEFASFMMWHKNWKLSVWFSKLVSLYGGLLSSQTMRVCEDREEDQECFYEFRMSEVNIVWMSKNVTVICLLRCELIVAICTRDMRAVAVVRRSHSMKCTLWWGKNKLGYCQLLFPELNKKEVVPVPWRALIIVRLLSLTSTTSESSTLKKVAPVSWRALISLIDAAVSHDHLFPVGKPGFIFCCF